MVSVQGFVFKIMNFVQTKGTDALICIYLCRAKRSKAKVSTHASFIYIYYNFRWDFVSECCVPDEYCAFD